jgi:hypothetical protein
LCSPVERCESVELTRRGSPELIVARIIGQRSSAILTPVTRGTRPATAQSAATSSSPWVWSKSKRVPRLEPHIPTQALATPFNAEDQSDALVIAVLILRRCSASDGPGVWELSALFSEPLVRVFKTGLLGESP